MVEHIKNPGNKWWQSIETILDEIGIQTTIQELKEISKEQWAREISNRLKAKEMLEIKDLLKNSSKCKNINSIGEAHPSLYKLQKEDAKIILFERLGITKDKNNYKNMYADKICQK